MNKPIKLKSKCLGCDGTGVYEIFTNLVGLVVDVKDAYSVPCLICHGRGFVHETITVDPAWAREWDREHPNERGVREVVS